MWEWEEDKFLLSLNNLGEFAKIWDAIENWFLKERIRSAGHGTWLKISLKTKSVPICYILFSALNFISKLLLMNASFPEWFKLALRLSKHIVGLIE